MGFTIIIVTYLAVGLASTSRNAFAVGLATLIALPLLAVVGVATYGGWGLLAVPLLIPCLWVYNFVTIVVLGIGGPPRRNYPMGHL